MTAHSNPRSDQEPRRWAWRIASLARISIYAAFVQLLADDQADPKPVGELLAPRGARRRGIA